MSMENFYNAHSNARYKLHSTINHVHMGHSTDNGHFTTYLASSKHRGTLFNRVYYDDENVTKLSIRKLQLRGIYFMNKSLINPSGFNMLTTQNRIEEIIQDVNVENLDPDI